MALRGVSLKLSSATGNLLFTPDNTYDIGASGATRPRSIFVGTNITAGDTVTTNNLFAGSSGLIIFNLRAGLNSDADGNLRLRNNAGTDFTRLQFGGTTDAFGAIARDGAGIRFTGAAGGATAHMKVTPVAIASLPAAATAGQGARAFVTDALAPVFGSAVAAGGAVGVPVYSTGAAWNVG